MSDANDLFKQYMNPGIKGLGYSELFGSSSSSGAATTTTASTAEVNPLKLADLEETLNKFLGQEEESRRKMDALLNRKKGDFTLITPEGEFRHGTPATLLASYVMSLSLGVSADLGKAPLTPEPKDTP